MADEKNLEALKIGVIGTYVDVELDKLLDLRNSVKKAKSEAEIKALVAAHIQHNQIGSDTDGKSTPIKEGETNNDSTTTHS